MRCEKAILITTLMRGRCFRKALRHYVLHAPIRHLLTIKRTKMNTTSLNHQFLVLKLPAVLAKEVGFHIQAITGVRTYGSPTAHLWPSYEEVFQKGGNRWPRNTSAKEEMISSSPHQKKTERDMELLRERQPSREHSCWHQSSLCALA